MSKAWGFMTMIEAGKCKPNLIRCPHNITAFSDMLVKKIKMVPYGRPQVIHFGKQDKAGYSLIQMIETSNITAHFAEESNTAFIDLFSCAPYDIEKVEETVREFFEPEILWKRFVERHIPEHTYMK